MSIQQKRASGIMKMQDLRLSGNVSGLTVLFCLTFGNAAHAYIGPGAGVALIGTFFGFAAAVLAAIIMVLAWPTWIVWKKWKSKKK